jgi:uncharacterized RDD family membrane protein YckC
MTSITEICPQCGSREIDPTGKCQVCGLHVVEEKAAPKATRQKEAGARDGLIEVDFSTSPQDQNSEMPEWRSELSRRLLEIKRRRGEGQGPSDELPAAPLSLPQSETTSNVRAKPAGDPPLITAAPAGQRAVAPAGSQFNRSRPIRTDRIVPLPERNAQRSPRPAKKVDMPLPLFQPARGKAGTKPAAIETGRSDFPKVMDPDPDKLQKLLDTIVLRQAEPSVPSTPGASAKTAVPEESGDMLILLSRTLSGFMDLVLVLLLTGGFVLAADFFSGVEMIDGISKAWYTALLLATYFLYATFFLSTANQTIGMMIKDLRVVGDNGLRPGLDQVLMLSAGFLLSIFALGVGLLWSFFDREHRCLHDRLSHTRVVRI